MGTCNYIQIIGWIGTILLASAGLPQLYKTINDGHAIGLAWYYLILVWVGMAFSITYVMLTTFSLNLICSYLFQMIVFGILIYRKKYPKEPMLH